MIEGVAADPRDLAVLRAMIAMARALELDVIAEGVETERELSIICGLGCRKIQGYYYGRPMTAQEALGLFGKSNLRQVS